MKIKFNSFQNLARNICYSYHFFPQLWQSDVSWTPRTSPGQNTHWGGENKFNLAGNGITPETTLELAEDVLVSKKYKYPLQQKKTQKRRFPLFHVASWNTSVITSFWRHISFCVNCLVLYILNISWMSTTFRVSERREKFMKNKYGRKYCCHVDQINIHFKIVLHIIIVWLTSHLMIMSCR